TTFRTANGKVDSRGNAAPAQTSRRTNWCGPSAISPDWHRPWIEPPGLRPSAVRRVVQSNAERIDTGRQAGQGGPSLARPARGMNLKPQRPCRLHLERTGRRLRPATISVES